MPPKITIKQRGNTKNKTSSSILNNSTKSSGTIETLETLGTISSSGSDTLSSISSRSSSYETETEPSSSSSSVSSSLASDTETSSSSASESSSTEIASDTSTSISSSPININILQNELENDYTLSNITNDFLNKKELYDVNSIQNTTEFNYLYPNLNDPNFNIKIAQKKEFADTKYDGEIKDVTEQAEILCNAEFELAPQQLFARNFLSFQTPYNSLLLYHGLGSGKTCTAISVAEEMRDYLKQIGNTQRIIVVASPNVQENFKLQLFDDRKLKLIDGLWNIRSCTGNKFLKEINPMNMKGLSKEKVTTQIKRIINNSYLFLGYIEFANYINKSSKIEGDMDEQQRLKRSKNKLRKVFENRLIVIDEVHNIRITDDNRDKRVALELFKLIENVENIRLLLLSATPMYNSYKEIIWLLNLMNMNDRRPTIENKDVFNSNGTFKTDTSGRIIGKELLERKATGYISFVRGENPYTFPYRIWPSIFSPNNTFKNDNNLYPRMQLNGKSIIQELEYIDVYLTKIGDYQQKGYNYIINKMKVKKQINKPKKNTKKTKQIEQEKQLFEEEQEEEKEKILEELPTYENVIESMGYSILQNPIQALNFIYPDDRLDKALEGEDINVDIKDLIGSSGLNRLIKYREISNPPSKRDFEYKSNSYPRIFSQENLEHYSSKIHNICKNVIQSDGIILIYSEFIDGGLVPIALALEELGLTRHGNVSSLFKDPPTAQVDYKHFKPKNQMPSGETFKPSKYIMITGDPGYSPDNVADVKALTSTDNKNGEIVKVVLISQAGSEGLDFQNIRQVHIMEPWYNMNRIEQIIGRAVRNCSHKALPFAERNVLIYLYGTLLEDTSQEAADLYIYRLAEQKALQIGLVSRALKEASVDCLLNYEQVNFTETNMNQAVKLKLSNKQTVTYQVGDKPFTSVCDYMDKCAYKCKAELKDKISSLDTYNEVFIFTNTEKIIQRIRNIFKDRHFFTKKELISRINVTKEYPIVQINAALTQLVEDKNEYITDQHGRLGNIINISDLYLFQPLELNNKNISLFERSFPIPYKNTDIQFELPEEVQEAIIEKPQKQIKLVIDEEEHYNNDIKNDRVNAIINSIEHNYELATNKNEIARGEKDWYKFCSSVIFAMEREGYDRNMLNVLLIEHIVESLLYDDTVILLNYLYNTKSQVSTVLSMIKDYFDSKLLKSRNITGLFLSKGDTQKLIIFRDNAWVVGEAEDYNDLLDEWKRLIIRPADLSKIIGFMSIFNNIHMVFKVKFTQEKRAKGSRCDQSGKNDAIKVLNTILNEIGMKGEYTDENTKDIKQPELCIRQEFILRMSNKNKTKNKRWFLTPIEYVLMNIDANKIK